MNNPLVPSPVICPPQSRFLSRAQLTLFVATWSVIALSAEGFGGPWQRMAPVAMLFLTALTTAGCGDRILRWWGMDARRPLEYLCLASALGWAGLSLLLCGLATLGLFEFTVWGPLAVVVSLILGFGPNGRSSGWDLFHDVWWSRLIRLYGYDVWTRAASIVTALVIGVTFLWAWGPVWDYDSEMYHLPNALRLIEQRQLVVDRGEPLANLPGQAYLWYAIGIEGRAEAYPALLEWWAAVLTSLLAARMAGRWLGLRVGLWTPPVFWSGMIVHAVASTPRVEPLYSLMFLAAVSMLFAAAERRSLDWGTVCCAGMCLGTAGAIKYQGFYGWPLIGLWWVWLWCRDNRLRSASTVVRVTTMFLVGFLVLSPWWIKNYRAFGNPIHPMFNRAKLDRDSLRNANPHGPHRSHPWYFLVVDTFDLFVKPNTFSGPPNQFPHYTFLLLPLLLVVGRNANKRPKGQMARTGPMNAEATLDDFETASVHRQTKGDFLGFIAGMSAAYYILSLTLTHELRHMFGMFSLGSILVAYVVVQFGLRWKLTVLLPGLVVASLAFVLLFPGRLFRLPALLQYTVGLTNERQLREQLVPSSYHRACEWLNGYTHKSSVVLLCWEARTYRLHRRAITDPGWATWRTLFRNRTTAEQVLDYLKRQRVDYILINAGSLEFNVNQSKLIPESDKQEFLRQRDLLVPHVLEPVFEEPKGKSKAVAVYRVRSR